MRLIIARHGKAAHNVAFELWRQAKPNRIAELPETAPEDVPLVEVGLRQARAAGQHLRGRRIQPQVACVSPTTRTRDTWQELGFTNVTPMLEPRLKEQHGGLFDRLPLCSTAAQRECYAAEAVRSPDARPPEGESIREHLERVEDWLHQTVRSQAGATVLAVTHYGSAGLLGMLCESLSLAEYLSRRPDHLCLGCGNLLAYIRSGRGWKRDFLFDNPHR